MLKKTMLVLTGARFIGTPTFFQEVCNLCVDLIEVLFDYFVLTMIQNWHIWVNQVNLVFDVYFRWYPHEWLKHIRKLITNGLPMG